MFVQGVPVRLEPLVGSCRAQSQQAAVGVFVGRVSVEARGDEVVCLDPVATLVADGGVLFNLDARDLVEPTLDEVYQDVSGSIVVHSDDLIQTRCGPTSSR